MTFGGGTNTAQDALDQFTTIGTTLDLQRYSNNFSLGSTLIPNSTLFIQYRVGGGLATNLGTNVINQIGTVSLYVNGPSELTNSAVVNSLRANNVTAAVGGAGVPSLEEIRNYVSFNFAAQKRAVTVQDYESIIRNMPSEFGAPAKVSVTENDNKILIQLLSYDTSGKLTSIVSNTLRQNVANYLSNYRMMNDYISILTAEVIDLSVEVSIVLDSAQNSGQIIANVIDKVSTYFNPQTRQLGQNVYLSELSSIIQNQNGVLTVAGVTIYNLVGGQYSSAETSMEYSDAETKQIAPVDDTIFAQPSQVYQIRYPNKDIKISVKNFQSVTFS
jgi:hypothetical protein